ncbi:MAG: TonB-dependent receptor plug domain-containing protein [Bacteroidota bacterium]|nr:TonB-dependent receptor plug domain-containing protein [Bacteroidota bacterium]
MARKLLTLSGTILLISAFTIANDQDLRTVTGVVTAFKTVPLSSVKIYASNSKATAFTDSAGMFSIRCAEKDILTISAAGFSGKKVKTGKDETYMIDLTYIDNEDNFREATSHGHISAGLLKQEVETKAARDVKDYSKYKTIYELISSEIYNVRVKGTTIVNTKVRSFDADPQVLCVVDGVIVSDISYITPDYVKSIEFIDDVGATLYGAKGANGVLKITLK